MNHAAPFIAAAGLTGVSIAGEGLEFVVYRATSPTYGAVALRVPRHAIYSNANDPRLESRDLLLQELAIYRHMRSQLNGVPVPRPYALLDRDRLSAALVEFIGSDETVPSAAELGRMLARLHAMTPPPGILTIAGEGTDALGVLPRRVARRWTEMRRFVPQLPPAPSEDELRPFATALARLPGVLLHMDWRPVNMRTVDGKIVAVIDWSNALIGPSVVEVYRVLELDGAGPGFLAAYEAVAPLPRLSSAEELLLRLDAALMLALVFLSEAPDPVAAKPRVDRVMELTQRLGDELAQSDVP